MSETDNIWTSPGLNWPLGHSLLTFIYSIVISLEMRSLFLMCWPFGVSLRSTLYLPIILLVSPLTPNSFSNTRQLLISLSSYLFSFPAAALWWVPWCYCSELNSLWVSEVTFMKLLGFFALHFLPFVILHSTSKSCGNAECWILFFSIQ